MRTRVLWLIVLGLLSPVGTVFSQPVEKAGRKVYVPYRDLAAVVDPAGKTVLMDRTVFAKLLADANANARAAATVELGQVTRAVYVAEVTGEAVSIRGRLAVQSMSDRPVAVPLGFSGIALTTITLDGKPAPLGYDGGKLVLIVTGRGDHAVELVASTVMKELAGGGMQFSATVPPAVAGTMRLQAPGDLEIHANVPSAQPQYDREADRTSVELTLGGHRTLAVVLMGNGRQDDQQAILIGESASTIRLTRMHQVLDCVYTVQVLRRGVRTLQFDLPAQWTITDVTSPNLVKWSVAAAESGTRKRLSVQLRSAVRGTRALHIRATAARTDEGAWQSPRLSLVDAAYQRGFLLVDPGSELRVRGEKLTDARREDVSAAQAIPGLASAARGRMYYHWGDRWSVRQDLATVSLRTASQERQNLTVSPEQLGLTGHFEVTAVGRELFEMDFLLPAGPIWAVDEVTVDGKMKGFEYRVSESAGTRTLRIELARPVRPGGTANVLISLRHVPAQWRWQSDTPPRSVAFKLIRYAADTISGVVAIAAVGDLDAAAVTVPEGFKAVTVGRMASLGLGRNVRAAYTYEKSVDAKIGLKVSRRKERISARAVGVITVRPTKLLGDWRIHYDISAARAKTLYLLVWKDLGRKVRITTHGRRLAEKTIVEADLPAGVPDGYHLWKLDLDGPVTGQVRVDVHFELPLPSGSFQAPLVRPFAAEQTAEAVAVQASAELAVETATTGARAIDTVELPPLPVQATRLLASYRLEGLSTQAGMTASVTLKTTLHEHYAVPAAMVTSAKLTTYLGPRGLQRTEARLSVVNAGMQFLKFRLPAGAELWSLQIAGRPAKPQGGAGDEYLLSLPRSIQGIDVRVVYGWSPSDVNIDKIELGPVSLVGIELNKVEWRVIPPAGYFVAAHDTQMQVEDLPRPAPAYAQLLDATADLAVGRSRELSKEAEAAGRARLRAKLLAGDADGDEGIEAATPAPRAPMTAPARQPEPTATPVWGYAQKVEGRRTLPVELVATAGAGRAITFVGLGQPKLTIGLAPDSRMDTWTACGFVLIGAIGIAMLCRSTAARWGYVVGVLAVGVLVVMWWPETTPFANGTFWAALCLAVLYALFGLVRLVVRLIRRSPKIVAAALLAGVMLAAVPAGAEQRTSRVSATPQKAPLIIPYDGDPAKADQAAKVLVPYARFVKLWNMANPDQQIEAKPPAGGVSLAGVKYAATVEGERMNIVLTAELATYGEGWVLLPMPMSGLAVKTATLDGKAARLRSGPNGVVLMLPGGTSGRLKVEAVTTPKLLGRRGSVALRLPPLPGAVMTVRLPKPDLQLEVPGVTGVVTRTQGPAGRDWLVPLGSARDVTLRWSPKVGRGAADRTLAAHVSHDVHAFHWGLAGVSKARFTFSAGEHDRFGLLVPDSAMLTALSGPNVRDFRVTGRTDVQGQRFQTVLVRLHRPAVRSYEMTLRWVAGLPGLGRPERLMLPRAANVGRESGSIVLYVAGGMTAEVDRISGGRRAGERSATARQAAELNAADTQAVGRFYWPYRPFAIYVKLSRPGVVPAVRLDQLVRIGAHRAELLASVDLTAEDGRIFGASFALPDGYELLSATGSEVSDTYEQPTPTGRRLHVNLRSGVTRTRLVLVLVRKDVDLARMAVPTLAAVNAAGTPLTRQTGRLAVQLEAALDAQTASSENLRSISPSMITGWLDAKQLRAVRFAYRYDQPGISLVLNVRPLPTRARAEVFGGLTVEATGAWYAYRVRYNISGSPVDKVSFTLPSEYASRVVVKSPSMRSVATADAGDGRTRWTVSLINEVTGVLDVAVNFSLPIAQSTAALDMPRLSPDALTEYRGIVAIQNFSRHELAVQAKKNLTGMAVAEQRKLLAGQVLKSLQYIYESFTDDWSITLKLTPAKPAARIQAVVDLMAITTVIDTGGRSRYQVTLDIQNRSEQFLRVRVPKGLKLWSARVAGQAVKPVTSASGADGEVMIPLVKTSPGGLPYKVVMYLAGDVGSGMGSIARLAPPRIEIVGVEVTRTTWSLRLPKGYRYKWVGGNMSPAAVAELMAIQTEVLIEQSKRLEEVAEQSASEANRRLAWKNYEIVNDKIVASVRSNSLYVADNRSRFNRAELGRLDSTLYKQRSYQEQADERIRRQKRREGEAGANVNTFLNASSYNGGVAELDRNSTLIVVPGFVQDAGRRQTEAITKQIQVAESKPEKRKLSGSAKKGFSLLEDVTASGKASEMDKLLGQLAEGHEREDDATKEALRRQLDVAGIDRTERYYYQQQAGGKLRALQRPRGGVALGDIPLIVDGVHADRGDGRTRASAGEDLPGRDSTVATKDGGFQYRVAGDRPAKPGSVTGPADAEAIPDDLVRAGYVSAGTFSLPIEMPEAGVRLDFARPSGDPEVTVWALRTTLIHKLYGTGALILAVALLAGALAATRFVIRRRRARKTSLTPA